MCGSKIPSGPGAAWRGSRTSYGALQLGIDYATEQSEALLAYGVPGFHFHSLEKARGVCAIFGNLKLQTLTAATG
jgi:methylenetetrahydrofolate reductase (NADPH)